VLVNRPFHVNPHAENVRYNIAEKAGFDEPVNIGAQTPEPTKKAT
jgi:hypothetical protein